MILSGGHAPDFEVFQLRGSSRGLGISHWRTSHFLQHSYSLFFWMDTHPCLIMSGIQSDCHYGDRLETSWNSFNLPVGHGCLNAEALYIHPRFRRICVLPQRLNWPWRHWAIEPCWAVAGCDIYTRRAAIKHGCHGKCASTYGQITELSGGFSQQTMFDYQRAHIKGENVSNQKIMTASFLKVLEGVQQVGKSLDML